MRLSIFSVMDHYEDEARGVGEFYAQALDQAEHAEQLGYDAFWVAEHHFHQYGVVPNPAVFLAVVAQRTRRLRLGTAISALTFHNALTLAENYAMVDVLSGGRLMYGVGSGYLPHEFAGHGIDPADKRARFDETLAAVEQLLTGERTSFDGRFQSFANLKLNVAPVQRPVPVYVGVLRKEAAYFVGRQGRNLMCVPYASVDTFDDIADIAAEFRRGRAEAGLDADADSLAVALHTHVAESDAAARRDAADAFDRYVATRLYARKATYDDVMRSGLHLFGSPAHVADKLAALRDMGIGQIMTLQNFGYLRPDLVEGSMRRLADEAAPLIRGRENVEARA